MLITQKKTKGSTEDTVYEYICENPGLCTYELAKRLRMSGGNLRSALSRLHKKGLVSFKFDKKNPRIKKLTYPVEFRELLPDVIKDLIKKKFG